MVGHFRTQGEKKHLMAFKISAVASQEEYDAHMLEVVYSRLKLKNLQKKINGQIGGGNDGTLSNSMMGGALGVQGSGSAGAYSGSHQSSFGNKNYDLVYGMIRQSMDEAGLNRDVIFTQVKLRDFISKFSFFLS